MRSMNRIFFMILCFVCVHGNDIIILKSEVALDITSRNLEIKGKGFLTFAKMNIRPKLKFSPPIDPSYYDINVVCDSKLLVTMKVGQDWPKGVLSVTGLSDPLVKLRNENVPVARFGYELSSDSERVLVTGQEMTALLQKQQYVFVLFGDRHTSNKKKKKNGANKQERVWDMLTDQVKQSGLDVSVVRVDCAAEHDYCAHTAVVSQYPAVQLYINGNPAIAPVERLPFKKSRRQSVRYFLKYLKSQVSELSAVPGFSTGNEGDIESEQAQGALDPMERSFYMFMGFVFVICITFMGYKQLRKYGHSASFLGRLSRSIFMTVAPAQVVDLHRDDDEEMQIGKSEASGHYLPSALPAIDASQTRDVPVGFKRRAERSQEAGSASDNIDIPSGGSSAANAAFVHKRVDSRGNADFNGGISLQTRLGELLMCHQQGLLTEEEYQQSRASAIRHHVVSR